MFERLYTLSKRLYNKANSTKSASQPTTGSGAEVSLKELIALQLPAKGLRLVQHGTAANVLAGSHGSRFRGRGMDYAESRNYQAGDDIRNMDWRVTARTGQAHIKLYEEERERPVIVMLDLTPSMFFGTRGTFKSVQAANCAALIAWATVAGGDRIGALLFNGGHLELSPQSGKRGALRLLRHLVSATHPSHGLATTPHHHSFNQALKRLRRIVRPGSLLFIISDFYGVDEATDLQLLRLHHHHDLIAVRVHDVLEFAAPPAGRYGVSDGQQRSILDTHSRAQQQRYQHRIAEQHIQAQKLLDKYSIPQLTLTTDASPLHVLSSGVQKFRRTRSQQRHRPLQT